MENTMSAAQILLRSLPPKSFFNIISFGSGIEQMFPHSVPLDEFNFDKATRQINNFSVL